MDETKTAGQDSLPVTGQASDGNDGSTSKDTPKTYTESEVKEREEKARNDALAEAGRKAKEEKAAEIALDAEEIKDAQALKREVDIHLILEDYENGDPDKLQKFLDKFHIGTDYSRKRREVSKKEIQEAAETLFTRKSGPAPIKVDSGVTSGGGKPIFTREQIKDRKFWEANKEAIILAQQEGRIK